MNNFAQIAKGGGPNGSTRGRGANLAPSRYMLRAASVASLAMVCLAALGCRTSATEHVTRAERYIAQKKYDEAVLEYRAALKQDPNRGDARLRLADLHAQQGDVQ